MDEDAPNERRELDRSTAADESATTAVTADDAAGSASRSETETEMETETESESAGTESNSAGTESNSAGTESNSAGTEPAATDSSEPNSNPDDTSAGSMPGVPDTEPEESDIPDDVQKYARFKKMDGAQYDRVNEFLRDRTYITAREWAIARLCADFRTETGVEMTKIGENLPELVPFMTDTYTPQAVNQARSSFEDKVRTAGATFLYGAMCDFFTAEELDDVMYESTEVAKFLLEVEGVDLSVEDELEAEERISSVMREVRAASEELRAEDDS
ncbi:DUF5806 family protein [Natrialba taiwanensis]|nr:DUF5806 family protein [Natrialba taiwanensis]